MVENTTYSPFGEILGGGTVSRFDSEGKEYDSVVDDYDFHFRKMNPSWGLFLQPDTLIPNIYDPQSLNRYMFERGNPYKNVDPTGHCAEPVSMFFCGIAVAGLIGILIWAAKKFESSKPIDTEEAADIGAQAATELAPDAFEAVSKGGSAVLGKAIPVLQTAKDAYDAGQSLLDTYLPEEEEEEEKSPKLKLIFYIGQNGNEIAMLVPEGTTGLRSGGSNGGKWSNVEVVYVKDDGTEVYGLPGTPVPEGASPPPSKDDKKGNKN